MFGQLLTFLAFMFLILLVLVVLKVKVGTLDNGKHYIVYEVKGETKTIKLPL